MILADHYPKVAYRYINVRFNSTVKRRKYTNSLGNNTNFLIIYTHFISCLQARFWGYSFINSWLEEGKPFVNGRTLTLTRFRSLINTPNYPGYDQNLYRSLFGSVSSLPRDLHRWKDFSVPRVCPLSSQVPNTRDLHSPVDSWPEVYSGFPVQVLPFHTSGLLCSG